MKASKEMQEYFDNIEETTKHEYEIAQKARKKGIDPTTDVEVQLAKTLSDRVIGLISVLAPDLKDSKAPERIRELEEKYGILDWRVCFKIAEDIAKEKFCEFEDEKEAIEMGIRTGFAYTTLGVVSAPIEGFDSLDIKKTQDGKDYFCLNYAGPVRNAGGTAASVSVLIADYLRVVFGYAPYDPTDKEIQRCFAELRDYHERVTNLQYFPSEDECEMMMENLPVEINGDPSERYEISNANLKQLPRIDTDIIRSGYCLLHSSCLPLKAPKLWKYLKDWGEDFDMGHWNFLKDFVKLQKEKKSEGGESDSEGIKPDYTYIKDLVSGRPVLGHPMKHGGMRLRYGRSRNTGMASMAMHPASMAVTQDFIGTGTQLKTERPDKAASMNACDTIEGPRVKLKDGSVMKLDSYEEAKKYRKDIKEILYLGDVLSNYGDFLEAAHPLVPPGYCEEYWFLEVKEVLENNDKEVSAESLSKVTGIDKEKAEELFQNPIETKVSLEDAKSISEELDVPLNPQHIYFWDAIEKEGLMKLTKWLGKAEEADEGYQLEIDENAKRQLELIGTPHLVVNQDHVKLGKETYQALKLQLNDFKEYEGDKEDVLEILNEQSPVKIKDRSGTFIGARMGRPEKAKLRKLKGSPHGLFPVGEEGGRMRSFQAALEEGHVKAQFKTYVDEDGEETPYQYDHEKQKRRKPVTEVKEEAEPSREFEIDIQEHFDKTLKTLGMKAYPDLIKGVRGTMSREHDAEDLGKGILRAHHSLHVNKDGTVRYDCSELPLTHFKPKEVNVSIKKLRELGYKKDINGDQLKRKDQVLELKPQDLVLPCCPDSPEEPADEVMYRTTKFIDDILEKLYGLEPYYNLDSKKDLAGQYVVGLAPHTSAGMVGRIIGFSENQGFLAHPLFHAAMRRDCDGDESCFVLLMDALLNFSKKYLPETTGSTMDAPLVLTLLLNPSGVDDQVFGMDVTSSYSLDFYRAAENYTDPGEIDMHVLEDDLETERQYEGMSFTHDVSDINKGVLCSAYKKLPSMEEKLKGQMELAEKLRAVELGNVAQLVIERHFIRDTKGNLKKFSQQEFRCVKCNEKYRRPPLSGKCEECGGRLLFTISEGGVVKYLEPSVELVDEFQVPFYLQQSVKLLKRRVEEVFGKEKERQESLGNWFG